MYNITQQTSMFCDCVLVIGTFLHMAWQCCPEVNRFWENVAKALSNIMERELLLTVATSTEWYNKYEINHQWTPPILAGLTAAKKMIACLWKVGQPLSVGQWFSSFKEIAELELSAARLHVAKNTNISCWSNLLCGIRSLSQTLTH